jgi:hypothetical protein
MLARVASFCRVRAFKATFLQVFKADGGPLAGGENAPRSISIKIDQTPSKSARLHYAPV